MKHASGKKVIAHCLKEPKERKSVAALMVLERDEQLPFVSATFSLWKLLSTDLLLRCASVK